MSSAVLFATLLIPFDRPHFCNLILPTGFLPLTPYHRCVLTSPLQVSASCSDPLTIWLPPSPGSSFTDLLFVPLHSPFLHMPHPLFQILLFSLNTEDRRHNSQDPISPPSISFWKYSLFLGYVMKLLPGRLICHRSDFPSVSLAQISHSLLDIYVYVSFGCSNMAKVIKKILIPLSPHTPESYSPIDGIPPRLFTLQNVLSVTICFPVIYPQKQLLFNFSLMYLFLLSKSHEFFQDFDV